MKTLRGNQAWQILERAVTAVRMWSRRSIFGDREFLKIQGPATVLVQSRGWRLRDVVTREDVEETAGIVPGTSVKKSAESAAEKGSEKTTAPKTVMKPGVLKQVTVGNNGKVEFQDSDFREFRK